MLTSNLVQEPTIKVRLPKSKTAESTRNDIKTIYITKDGSIFFMDKKIELKDISRVVKGVLNDQEIEFIRIKADKEADVGVLVSVIDEVRLTGVKNYSIVTEKKGE
jgi:biopolymer transport protein ExbD